ncbi:MAG: hypothetical protein P4L82_16725 [Ancalomicrobiaceae bacterium]|nr:hypothetical protein [Ancalomicrobiaceae bacterium]
MSDVGGAANGITYTFRADVSDLKANVRSAQDELRKTGMAAQEGATQMAKGMKLAADAANDNAKAMKLNTTQVLVLGGALRHTVDGFISGQSAMRILTVEGIKASAAFGGIASAGLIAAAAVVGGTALAVAGILAWGEAYQKLERTAKLTGESIVELNKMQEIANRTLGGFDVAKGVSELALKIREAQVAGNETAKMFERIGIPLKDATGKAREFKDVLNDVAVAIRDGNNEADKIELAKKLGLGADAVPWLESYASKLRAGRLEITATDREIVKLQAEAAKFDEEWRKAWQDWETRGKAAAYTIFTFLKNNSDYAATAAVALPLVGPGITANYWEMKLASGIHAAPKPGTPTDRQATPLDRMNDAFRLAEQNPLGETAPKSRDLSGVYSPPKAKTEPKSDAAENFIKSLDRQNAALKAQAENFNKSAQEQNRAIEVAKFDITVKDNWKNMTDQQRAAVDGLRERVKAAANEMTANKAQLTQLEGIRDAWKEAGDSVANAFDQMIVKGAKFQDVMKSLIQSLESSVLKGLLTGEGAFGKAFGLASSTGGLGGLLGGLFSMFGGPRAAGGSTQAGKIYKVGENGEEWFRPSVDGTVIPNDQVRNAQAAARPANGQQQTIINNTTLQVTTPDAPSFARSEQQLTGFLNRAIARSARSA